MGKKRDPVQVASKAMAELYVWDAVVSILEGSTKPRSRSGQRAASRVIQICKQECQRRLREYDAAAEGAPP
jgi:hypothetical protein